MSPEETISCLLEVVPKLIANIESICDNSFRTTPPKKEILIWGRRPRAVRIAGDAPMIPRELTPEEKAEKEAYKVDLKAVLATQAALVSSLPTTDHLLEGFRAHNLDVKELYEVLFLLSNQHPEKRLPGTGASPEATSHSDLNLFGWNTASHFYNEHTQTTSNEAVSEISRVKSMWESTAVSLRVVRGYFSNQGTTRRPKKNTPKAELEVKISQILQNSKYRGKKWRSVDMFKELQKDPSVKTNLTAVKSDRSFKAHILITGRSRGPREPKRDRNRESDMVSGGLSPDDEAMKNEEKMKSPRR